MWKKLTVSILCVFLLLGSFPWAAGSETQDLRTAVEAQYDAYAASLAQQNAADDTADLLLSHSLYGKGEALHLTEESPVAAAFYESNLFRVFLTETLTLGSQVMQEQQLTQGLFGTDGLGWHEFALEYRVTQYHLNDTPDPEDDVIMTRHIDRTLYNGPKNECDNILRLVVGGSGCRVRMQLLGTDQQTATYWVDVYTYDHFEFAEEFDYAEDAGYNTSFSKLVAALAPLLGLKEYYWDCVTGFELTVPLATAPAYLAGDADEDGEVTYMDAIAVLRTAAGLAQHPIYLCDMNGDGDVTYLDAVAILRHAVGL